MDSRRDFGGNVPYRTEHDSLGEVGVPADALYGAHTVRAVANFSASGVTMRERPELIVALGEVKAAAARANRDAGALPRSIGDAILAAAREVADGQHDAEFPIDVMHGGGGTAVNMNANEVIANRAIELSGGTRGDYGRIHPNDHVNRSQSTNDVYPTALALATYRVGHAVVTTMNAFAAALTAKADEYPIELHLGRTCLQDAVPLRIADTHRSQAYAADRTSSALRRALDAILEVPLGATAVGTGVGADPGYLERVVEYLADETGLPVRRSPDLFDSLAYNDGYFDVAAQLFRCSIIVSKIASDLRLLCSGPMAGIGEVVIPAVQVGSSIMPGKINPVLPELVLQEHAQVQAAVTAVSAAVSGGELELNVMEPVIARYLLGAMREFARAVQLFTDRCVVGLQWNLDTVCRNVAAGSLDGAVERALDQGYERVAKSYSRSAA
jgi:aspartate ammonia-lyase